MSRPGHPSAAACLRRPPARCPRAQWPTPRAACCSGGWGAPSTSRRCCTGAGPGLWPSCHHPPGRLRPCLRRCRHLAHPRSADPRAGVSCPRCRRTVPSPRPSINPAALLWLSEKTPRDEEFRKQIEQLCELYTRPLATHERVLCVDEKTSLQPRTRTHPTRPPQPGLVPARLEHEYGRKGALNLLEPVSVGRSDSSSPED